MSTISERIIEKNVKILLKSGKDYANIETIVNIWFMY